MIFEGERQAGGNRRRGPGWWLDDGGMWRAPEEWPEDYPPLTGWVRNPSGGWLPPGGADDAETRWMSNDPSADGERRDSRQAKADKQAIAVATGALAACLVLLVGAMILISQAGASRDDPADPGDDVIYAADPLSDTTDRLAVISAQPAIARQRLDELPAALDPPADAAPFDPAAWIAPDIGCRTMADRILEARSQVAVTFDDSGDCRIATGRWTDRENGSELTSAGEAEVISFVPASLVHSSGGWNWTQPTRIAFAADVSHPAVHQVVAAGAGHNPRAAGPEDWRPADRSQWCAYAVDWTAVKHRWKLSVTDAERAALAMMLETCDEATSTGADPLTVPNDDPPGPRIRLLDG